MPYDRKSHINSRQCSDSWAQSRQPTVTPAVSDSSSAVTQNRAVTPTPRQCRERDAAVVDRSRRARLADRSDRGMTRTCRGIVTPLQILRRRCVCYVIKRHCVIAHMLCPGRVAPNRVCSSSDAASESRVRCGDARKVFPASCKLLRRSLLPEGCCSGQRNGSGS